jgi:hypothetical protein
VRARRSQIATRRFVTDSRGLLPVRSGARQRGEGRVRGEKVRRGVHRGWHHNTLTRFPVCSADGDSRIDSYNQIYEACQLINKASQLLLAAARCRAAMRNAQALYTKLQEHIATLDTHSKLLNDFLQSCVQIPSLVPLLCSPERGRPSLHRKLLECTIDAGRNRRLNNCRRAVRGVSLLIPLLLVFYLLRVLLGTVSGCVGRRSAACRGRAPRSQAYTCLPAQRLARELGLHDALRRGGRGVHARAGAGHGRAALPCAAVRGPGLLRGPGAPLGARAAACPLAVLTARTQLADRLEAPTLPRSKIEQMTRWRQDIKQRILGEKGAERDKCAYGARRSAVCAPPAGIVASLFSKFTTATLENK